MDDDFTKMIKSSAKCLFPVLVGIIVLFWSISAVSRVYEVWAQGKEGEAELAKADSNRQIKTLEAKAAEESAKHLANAEIIRAQGVAKANEIIGASLKENEAYLRYLWIDSLQHSKGQVVYVPTEANLPILEARRLKQVEE
jgi:regulator of protease activity HflC (stomatin/prohibitin superfamily)